MRFIFNPLYFFLTIILFLTELAIALFVKDTIIRPFVGDVLVVVLSYCFLRTFLRIKYWKIALGVLLFAFIIEILQYFDYVKILGFGNCQILSIVLGRTFESNDFFAYLTGFLLILLTEKTRQKPAHLSGHSTQNL